jgi:hypothetical protein
MKGRRILISVLALGLLLALAVGLSQAQGSEPPEGAVGAEGEAGVAAIVGDGIPIQGRLTDAAGNPVPDGDYTMTFRLYDVSSEGEPLCEDTHDPGDSPVNVTNGLFTAYMSGCTADVINGQQLYLGIEVGSDGEMTPRQHIYPVPYAWSLRPGAVISDTTSYVGLNRYTSYMGISSMNGIYARASGALFNYGVYGISEENWGAGVSGTSHSSNGYGGYFDSTGVGLYARGGSDSVDLVLGGEDDTAAGDNGRIRSDPAYPSSDMYLTSNDAVLIELDANDDEDGAFRVQSSGTSLFQVEDNGRVSIPTNATGATTINVGDRYRDNAIIAWANVNSDGTIGWDFGVASVTRAGAGNYIVELDAETAGTSSFIPIAIAEVESQPDSAAEARIVSINQTAQSIFRVYITDGNWTMVDNQFIFMVTGR